MRQKELSKRLNSVVRTIRGGGGRYLGGCVVWMHGREVRALGDRGLGVDFMFVFWLVRCQEDDEVRGFTQ